MLVVERFTHGQRPRELAENVREKAVMQVNHRLAPILARPHQPDHGIVGIGVGVKLRVAAEIAEALSGKSIETSALSAIGCNDIYRAPLHQVSRHRPHMVFDAAHPRDPFGGDDERPLFLLGVVRRP